MTDSPFLVDTVDYEITRLASRSDTNLRSDHQLTFRHYAAETHKTDIMSVISEIFVGRREMGREQVSVVKEVTVNVDYPANLWHLLLYAIPFTRRFAKMKAKPVVTTVTIVTENVTNYYIDPLIDRYLDRNGMFNGSVKYRLTKIDGRLTTEGYALEMDQLDKMMTNGYYPPYERAKQ